MEIAAILLLEGNPEGMNVKFAARLRIADDRPETRDEQDLCLFQSLHAASPVRPWVANRHPISRACGVTAASGFSFSSPPSLHELRRRAPLAAEDELGQGLAAAADRIPLAERLRRGGRVGGVADRQGGEGLHPV